MAYHALRSVYDLSPIYGSVQFYTAHETFIVKLYEKLQNRLPKRFAIFYKYKKIFFAPYSWRGSGKMEILICLILKKNQNRKQSMHASL